MKTLFLPLKKEWYEMIERGEKTEEYREIKPYWCVRLCDFRCKYSIPTTSVLEMYCRFGGICPAARRVRANDFSEVCFSYGYTRRTMTFEVESITIGRGRPEWGAPDCDVFIIKLGRRLV